MVSIFWAKQIFSVQYDSKSPPQHRKIRCGSSFNPWCLIATAAKCNVKLLPLTKIKIKGVNATYPISQTSTSFTFLENLTYSDRWFDGAKRKFQTNR